MFGPHMLQNYGSYLTARPCVNGAQACIVQRIPFANKFCNVQCCITVAPVVQFRIYTRAPEDCSDMGDALQAQGRELAYYMWKDILLCSVYCTVKFSVQACLLVH